MQTQFHNLPELTGSRQDRLIPAQQNRETFVEAAEAELARMRATVERVRANGNAEKADRLAAELARREESIDLVLSHTDIDWWFVKGIGGMMQVILKARG